MSSIPVVQLTGPLVVGYEINWGLYGILCMQTYVYYQASLDDKNHVKFLVYGLWIWETLQTILATHDSFHTLALGWGNLEKLQATNFVWLQLPIMTGISSAVIQCFYAWRIYLVGRSKVLAIFVVLLALMQGSAALAEGIEVLVGTDMATVQVLTLKSCSVWLGGTALCDTTICISMLYFLARSRTGFQATDRLINRLIVVVIETGMATALVAIVDLIFFVVYKHNFYHIATALTLSKLYANSLLVLLNDRISMRSHNESSVSTSQISSSRRGRASNAIQINIQNETCTDNVAMFKLKDQTSSGFNNPLAVYDGTNEC